MLRRIGPGPIYGWEFFDVPAADSARWDDRLSLDWRSGRDDGMVHTLTLFQGGESVSLDLQLWFDDLGIASPRGDEIDVDVFIAGGKRWWDALYAGDPRTAGAGIVLLVADETRELAQILRDRSERRARLLLDRVTRRLRGS